MSRPILKHQVHYCDPPLFTMGNSNTKESRPDNGDASRRPSLIDSNAGRESGTRSGRRSSRADLSIFGIGHGSSSRDRDRPDAPFERRETKQEREARRLERERIARAKERERSMREEHVDGGYPVPLGTYTGTADFSKPVVRQLQVNTPGFYQTLTRLIMLGHLDRAKDGSFLARFERLV